MTPVRWGILGTARIARHKVIPAMQASPLLTVAAIASRDPAAARQVAADLQIPRAHASYQDLLDDPDLDAVYIPLPNHLHVPWTIRALEAGKHVLCEKPIALDGDQAALLLAASRRFPRLKVMEAFMHRFHPQWLHAQLVIEQGMLGRLQLIQAVFAYHNVDPNNVRNRAGIGGGGLLDIGCYCVHLARHLFAGEPRRVVTLFDHDPDFGTDRLTSALLDFAQGQATFTCATQLCPGQRVLLLGTAGSLELAIPFNAPLTGCHSLLVNNDRQQRINHPACNQYTLLVEAFCRAIAQDLPVPLSLAHSLANMRVLDALTESGRHQGWITMS